MLVYTGKAEKGAKPPKRGRRQNLISIKKA